MAVFGIAGFADEGCLRSRERRRASGGEVGTAAEESKEEWEAGERLMVAVGRPVMGLPKKKKKEN